MTQKHRVLSPFALGRFSQERAAIKGCALSKARKFNDFSVWRLRNATCSSIKSRYTAQAVKEENTS
jgi:hypothetical protein